MNIALSMVTTLNGKITHADDPDVQAWTSPEDQTLFTEIKQRYPVIVMGRKTYEAARPRIAIRPGVLRVVLTKHPERYQAEAVPGSVEFTDGSPEQVAHDLEDRGYADILLAGGAEVNAQFFQAGLVNELHLTLEPQLFGEGKNVVIDGPFVVSLRLKNVDKLNDRGTLHLVYAIEA